MRNLLLIGGLLLALASRKADPSGTSGDSSPPSRIDETTGLDLSLGKPMEITAASDPSQHVTLTYNELVAARTALRNQYRGAYEQYVDPLEAEIRSLNSEITSGGYRGATLQGMIAQRDADVIKEQGILAEIKPIWDEYLALGRGVDLRG